MIVCTLPPPFPSPTLRLAMRIGKLVAWESWARFVMRTGTGHSSADHREVRTALSLSSGHPSGTGPSLVFYGE